MNSLATLLLNSITRILSWCPRSLQWQLARLIAQIGLICGFRSAVTTRINLRHCYPDLQEQALRKMTKASLTQTAMLLLESGMVMHWNEAQLNHLIAGIVGEEQLRDALDSAQGVLLLVPHFGNWEFLALYLGRFDMVALYEPPRQQFLEAPIRASRERTGATLLPLQRSGLRAALQTLRRGGLLGILPDQVPDRNAGLHVPFFAEPALTMKLVHRLIGQISPIVLMGSAIRTQAGFELYFCEVSEEIKAPDPTLALSALNREIELLIDKAPEQYQWEYKRFKSPPEGRAKIY